MLKTYFLFTKHYYFTFISVFLLTQPYLCAELNGRSGEVDENGESGENGNSGENLPQFRRIFKVDGKRGSLESGGFEKRRIWPKIAKGLTKLLQEVSLVKMVKLAKKWQIWQKLNRAKISHDFGEGPLGGWRFDENGENLAAVVKMTNLAKNRSRADETFLNVSLIIIKMRLQEVPLVKWWSCRKWQPWQKWRILRTKWRLRNEHRNSLMMTCQYLDLNSNSDWLKQIPLAIRQIKVLPRSG